MSVHESGEMYLEAILVLSQKNGFVRSIDVSEYLGYSKPSVSRAVGILKKGEYIRMEKDGCLILTDSGKEIAAEREDILVGKVNVDEEMALAVRFGIVSIPTLIVMKNGEVANKAVGFMPKADILKLL